MRTPCPVCGTVTMPCTCEEDLIEEQDDETLAEVLRKRGYNVVKPRILGPSLDTRDPAQDQPCTFCYEPLWKIHPDGPHELQWGHVSREAAMNCTKSRRPGVWPVPEEKK